MRLDFLKRDERLAIELKALYRSYGFGEYKLSGFEDYSLYAEHKSFLEGKGVLSFVEGGKLLALRPDVTLSIVKNVPADGTKKLFYAERVYRKTAGGSFAELRQLGVETLGDIDKTAEREVVSLILATLGKIGENYVLDISHTGIIVKITELLNLTSSGTRFALGCLESKNVHDFIRFAGENNLDKRYSKAFAALIELTSEPTAAIAKLREIAAYTGINQETDELEQYVKTGGGRVNINFSVFGASDYYNGAVFKGYVEGIPHAVLSGGRYDKLLEKFGKKAEAVGFALYLGEISKYFKEQPDAPDEVIVYTDETAERAYAAAQEARGSGKKVLLSREVPRNFNGNTVYAENCDD